MANVVCFSTSGVLASKKSTSDSYNRRIMLKFDTENYIPANVVHPERAALPRSEESRKQSTAAADRLLRLQVVRQ